MFDEGGGASYSKRAGRTALSNKLKMKLIELHGARCFIYLEPVAARELQIDHRIPYEVAGDGSKPRTKRFHVALWLRESGKVMVL